MFMVITLNEDTWDILDDITGKMPAQNVINVKPSTLDSLETAGKISVGIDMLRT